jgi:hypothetical protein
MENANVSGETAAGALKRQALHNPIIDESLVAYGVDRARDLYYRFSCSVRKLWYCFTASPGKGLTTVISLTLESSSSRV